MADEPEVILAAGGLLWRGEGAARQLAVLHRARHDDLSLPKGKLDDGEGPDEAALREVREETGWEAEITGYAGHLTYEVGGTPKVVFFWHMGALADRGFAASEEVAEPPRWLAPEEAAERLSYEGERALVRRALAAPATAG